MTPTVYSPGPSGPRLLLLSSLVVPPDPRLCASPLCPYPVVTIAKEGIQLASWVLQWFPDIRHTTRDWCLCQYPVFLIPTLFSLPIHITSPTAGPDAKPTSSGLPGREGKDYLVLQPSSLPGRSVAGYLMGAAAFLGRNKVLSPLRHRPSGPRGPVSVNAGGFVPCSGLRCPPTPWN